MDNTVYTIDEIRRRFLHVTRKYDIAEAYLFGSYARGDATHTSDLDFYIRTGKLTNCLDISGIWVDTEKAMNKKIDIVYADQTEIDKEFEEEMRKNFIKIYG